MSSLYTLINQEAAKQKQQVEQTRSEPPVEKSDQSERPQSPTPKRSTSKKRKNRSTERRTRTDKPNGQTERGEQPKTATEQVNEHRTLIDEMNEGVEKSGRSTERYSFEIFTDQKESILEIKYRYEKRTGQRLSKSRIIREALDIYFDQVLK